MSIGSNRSLYHFILKTLGTFPQVGVTLIENVVSCIERSRKIVLILSDAFLQNNWCHFETHVALTQMVEHERWDADCVSNMRHSSGTRSSWSNYQPSEVSRHQMWTTWSKVAPLCPGTNHHTSMDNLRPCKTDHRSHQLFNKDNLTWNQSLMILNTSTMYIILSLKAEPVLAAVKTRVGDLQVKGQTQNKHPKWAILEVCVDTICWMIWKGPSTGPWWPCPPVRQRLNQEEKTCFVLVYFTQVCI